MCVCMHRQTFIVVVCFFSSKGLESLFFFFFCSLRLHELWLFESNKQEQGSEETVQAQGISRFILDSSTKQLPACQPQAYKLCLFWASFSSSVKKMRRTLCLADQIFEKSLLPFTVISDVSCCFRWFLGIVGNPWR